jgi:hypothetical protein
MADTPDTSKDISVEDGKKITAEAATWKGTPYAFVGDASAKGETGGGDCSGTTCKIYKNAGFEFAYQATATFPKFAIDSGLFRKLGAGESKQDGDVLMWSDHMAIYSSFTSPGEVQFKTTARVNKANQPWTQHNDMWTASHPGGSAYRPSAILWSGKSSAPEVYRWIGTKK